LLPLRRDPDDGRTSTGPPVESENPLGSTSIDEVRGLLIADIDVVADPEGHAFERDTPSLALEQTMDEVRQDDDRFGAVDS
ncbi:MAG: hypothetical protein R3324_09425, partial [Halobacteriales archaeon]|nr:hypothetical protein [Halobacteriales archaeon]